MLYNSLSLSDTHLLCYICNCTIVSERNIKKRITGNNTEVLACPPHKELDILEAKFFDENGCNKEAKNIVGDICNGKDICRLDVEDDRLKQLCQYEQVNNTLEVVGQCVQKKKITVGSKCHNSDPIRHYT